MFTMPTPVAYTGPYQVTVQTQPTGLTCTVSNGAGSVPAGNVTNIAVTCSISTFTISGTITGLTATGLELFNNGAATTPATSLPANATQFTLQSAVAYGASYAVTAGTNPSGEGCVVTNGSGQNVTSAVTTVAINCVGTSFTTPSVMPYTFTVPAGVTSIQIVATGSSLTGTATYAVSSNGGSGTNGGDGSIVITLNPPAP